ncbi:hypothetical protein DAPPUDRAFT_332863 [Daphnia pulex]|uniref:Uncharacterized protein n=1 Tax=Daphnia pulex TaxID=6669 RepID=E9HR54_DAPPU|nr:hypothetical protein DAPPUDRAFT_332863 [Daphnia pulex]|eukprot:EFX65780.1 hypothetical protein DAPPUDRAFT_332863 [Daphnia pulex]
MAHGESFEIVTLESDEEVFEQELIQSESVSVENYDVDELSYNEYLNTRCELELFKVNQIEQLWRQRDEYRKEIESLLIRKNCISHFTPFGAAFKVTEITANKYYNSRTMADRFRQKYIELPDETKMG